MNWVQPMFDQSMSRFMDWICADNEYARAAMVLFQYDAVTDPVTGHMVRWSVGAFLSPRAGKITTYY